jgi:hypothetical protein
MTERMHWKNKKYKHERKNHLKELEIDGRITFKWDLKD